MSSPEACEQCDGTGEMESGRAWPASVTCDACGGEGLAQDAEDAARWAEWKRVSWPQVIRNTARGECAT